jgi:DNA-binding CsgD family transcriptional regulator
VLVLRGEAGIGKTALLEFLVETAAGFRVSRAAGVESELELAYAGLHQLCGPYLDRIQRLPPPQGDALSKALGLATGQPPDRFLVGLATLTLLCDVAETKPLLCVIDDAQWLDQASAQALEFVARRLGAEPVGMVFAVRTTDQQPKLAGLPEQVLRGLSFDEAAALLTSVVAGTLDPRVRDRILAEAHGNPLALIELPRSSSVAELMLGAAPRVTSHSLMDRLERGFIDQLSTLTPPSRQLLLTAAAEPTGDVSLLWRAADKLRIATDAATDVEALGLLDLRERVQFRHPLVRSAVYRAATKAERRQVHQALADATSVDTDPDRRAWHRAQAARAPDEEIAQDLARSADRALASGGLAAAAAFLELAATLTPEPAKRAQRSLVAAQAKATAGSFDQALHLLSTAQTGPIDEAGAATIELLRAQVAYNSRHDNSALPLFLDAARRLQPIDPELARSTYLDALSAAVMAGHLVSGGDGLRQVATAIRDAPPTTTATRSDLLLDGMAVLHTDGYVPAVPLLRRAVQAFAADDLTLDEAFRSVWFAAVTAMDLWDDVHWDRLSQRHLDVVRSAGALSLLPLALVSRAAFDIYCGDLPAAESLIAESVWIADVTGGENTFAPLPQAWVAAMRGDEVLAELLIRDTLNAARSVGQGVAVNTLQAARAVLCISLGRYDDAVESAREAATNPLEPGPPKWALAELVEAAVLTGNRQVATDAFDELSPMTIASGTDLALGMRAARGALLQEGAAAEELYCEAIDRLSTTRIRVEHHRATLRYGEWLRRQGRQADARSKLRDAFDNFSAMGLEAFANRARRELLAIGETVHKRTPGASQNLTPQESKVAQMAEQGLTNVEIGAALYLSPRTVEWHLHQVFTKLGISSRRELRRVAADEPAS